MRPIPLSLIPLAALFLATACQSPSRPEKNNKNVVAVSPEGNGYLNYIAEVSEAFSNGRSDTAFAGLIGPGSGNQVKLLTREVPLLTGDINEDRLEDILAGVSVLTSSEEKLLYAVFVRDGGKLRLAQLLTRAGRDPGTILTLMEISSNFIVWGMEAEPGKPSVWNVGYKWTGKGLEEVTRAPSPPEPQ